MFAVGTMSYDESMVFSHGLTEVERHDIVQAAMALDTTLIILIDGPKGRVRMWRAADGWAAKVEG